MADGPALKHLKIDPEEIADLKSRLTEASTMISALQAENEDLRTLLQVGPSQLMPPPGEHRTISPAGVGGVSAHSPEVTKIALFRSLFRGREEVYAYRWEGREGKSGYSPALRLGARRLKGQRPDPETLLPLDDEVIQSHLLGRRVVGVYPLLADETCWFLAIDFDKSTWQSDVAEVMRSCEELGVPASIERSRSGHGGQTEVAPSRRAMTTPLWPPRVPQAFARIAGL